jgi:hypothetical protein
VIIGARPGRWQRRYEIAAMPFNLSGKLQSKQSRPYLPRRSFRHAGEFVDRDRHRSEQRDQTPLDVVQPPGGFRLGRFRASAAGGNVLPAVEGESRLAASLP